MFCITVVSSHMVFVEFFFCSANEKDYNFVLFVLARFVDVDAGLITLQLKCMQNFRNHKSQAV